MSNPSSRPQLFAPWFANKLETRGPLTVLATKAGVSRQTLTNWANGSFKPDSRMLIMVCSNIGINPAELIKEGFVKNTKENQHEIRLAQISRFLRDDTLSEAERVIFEELFDNILKLRPTKSRRKD